MNRLMLGTNSAIIGLCTLGAVAAIFMQFDQKAGQLTENRPEVWRSLDVDDSTKAFDATGSRTNFLMAASDDGGQHMILGVSHVGNGVPWLARLSDGWVLDEPLLLSEGTIRVPRPELFAVNNTHAAFVENERVGERGGGVYNDFDLFDPDANEISRYYRIQFSRCYVVSYTRWHCRCR